MELFDSGLVQPQELLEYLIDRVEVSQGMKLEVNKFSAADEDLGKVVPPVTYIENCVEDKTRIRVHLALDVFAAGEKVQVKLLN